MLNFKNAQTLSRTEMKNLMGGSNEDTSRAICPDFCFVDEQTGERSCGGELICQSYRCNPHSPTIGYKCV